jgi:O-antigen/teichoic acid export membrane protein/aminoglycoside phosphotransferase
MAARAEESENNIYRRILDHLSMPLFRNGYALTLSSMSTSAIGLLYWVIAAHEYPTSIVGINSALISAMVFLSGISELNLMSALIRFVPTAGRFTKRFVIYAYLTSFFVAAIVSAVFIIFLPVWSPALMFLRNDHRLAVWFILSTMTWCIFVMQDSVLTGLRKATWVPVENTIFSLVKISIMVIFATFIPSIGIFASWTLALIVAIVPTNYYIFRKLIPQHERIDSQWDPGIDRYQVMRYVAPDYLGALATIISVNFLPVIVTTLAGATANAYFYLSWTIANSLYLISSSMGSSLVVEAAKDQRKLGAYSYGVFLQAARLVVPAAVVVLIGAPYILSIFGKSYSVQGALLLRLLALSAIPNIFNAVFINVSRVRRRMRAVVITLGCLCVLLITFSVIGLKLYGIVGVGIAWVISQSIVALIVFFTQLKRLWSSSPIGSEKMSQSSHSKSFKTDLIRIAVSASSRLRLLSILKWPIAYRLAVNRRRKVSRLLPSINQEFHYRVQNSVSDATWQLSQMKHTETDTTVAFLSIAGNAPQGVLKLAGSVQDSASLRKSRETLQFLNNQQNLGEWRRLIPEAISSGVVAGQTYLIESVLPGVELRRILHDESAMCQRIGMLAATTINQLHAKTAHYRVVDEELFERWVQLPLKEIQKLINLGVISAAYRERINHLCCELHTALIGRKIYISWTHGDYSIFNVLVNPDGNEVTGIVDWDLAETDNLPQLDIVHLLLSIRLDSCRCELGEIVRSLLLEGGWTSYERCLIDSAAGEMGGDPISLRILLLLSWLHHINANLTKSSRFAHHILWTTENIEVVLQIL